VLFMPNEYYDIDIELSIKIESISSIEAILGPVVGDPASTYR